MRSYVVCVRNGAEPGVSLSSRSVVTLGQVLWELLCYIEPYPDLKNNATIIKAVSTRRRLPIPPSAPRAYAALIRQGWHADPDRRPTAQAMLALLKRMAAALPPRHNSLKRRK